MGRSFASKAERDRGEELALMEKAGQIRNLRFQVTVPLIVNKKLVCRWVADFTYEIPGKEWRGRGYDIGDGWWLLYHDEKGFRTPIYSLKAKLFEAIFGFPIYETTPKRKR